MSSFLTDADKSVCAEALESLFDTYQRPITVVKIDQTTYVAANQDFNFLYGNVQDDVITQETVTQHTIEAKIRYGKNQKQYFFEGKNNTNAPVNIDDSDAKIRVKKAGKDVIEDSKYLILDGVEYVVDGPPRPHKSFGLDHYTYNLKLRK